jgi:hypothetical protein
VFLLKATIPGVAATLAKVAEIKFRTGFSHGAKATMEVGLAPRE